MDFIDELRQFSKRVESLKDLLPTEEATKNALILPFFQMLGYDVFNPLEFLPEFTADIGIKKGEKVDYAILLDNKPAILIEAKWCGEALDKHDSQLFRYFGTTEAKFGILTNGIIYKFYTDLDEPNKMDLSPFLEFNLLDLNDSVVQEIKRFCKERIDIDAAFTAASELKYTNLIKSFLSRQRTALDDSFINYILGEVYQGRRTQQVVERFTPIIKKAYNGYINDVINDTLKSAMLSHEDEPKKEAADDETETTQIEPEEPVSKIDTTPEELEAYGLIKAILRNILPPDKVCHKDTESYFGILYDNNTRKWICRLKLDASKKLLLLPDEKYVIEGIDEILSYADQIIASAQRFVS
jgi:hypothetical protein|nr:MAG TPA: hypothetical protein [Caudoviricetes sp.]